MKPSKNSIILPIVLITLGIGWLLTSMEVAPEIDWIWTLSLAMVGVILLVVIGIDKMTVVCAPLLLVASVLSVFRQYDLLGLGVMVPTLVILAGSLLLVARRPSIPTPRWISSSNNTNKENAE